MSEPSPISAYDVLLFVRDWFGPSVGGGALLLVWRLSKGWADMQKDHEALKDEHAETKKKVSTVEERVNGAHVQIAKLATRDDLDRLADRMQLQLQTNFGQLLTLLGVKKDGT